MRLKNVRRLIKFKPAHRTFNASKRVILPGFEGLSLYLVSKFFFQGIRNGALNMRATSLAFSFFLALFPSVIFLFTLIPYIPIANFQDELFNLMKSLLPQSAFEATNGFNAMINAFNETYHQIETRSPLMQRLVAFLIVIVTTLLLLTAIALIIGTEFAFQRWIKRDNVEYYLIYYGQWFILVALCYSFISFNYFMGPKSNKGWRFFSAGSVFATILTIITSVLFAYYVNNFGNYNKLYGSIGTLIVIMLWLYINSLILLLGFDLNVSINRAKREKAYITIQSKKIKLK